MKTIMLGLMLLGLAGSAMAIEPSELDARLQRLTGMFEELQSKPDKCIPPEVLRNAQGIVLLDRTKAGFLYAYQGGVGVALVRDPHTGKWSAPAFLSANESSLGFQVGGEQAFYAVVLMTPNATHALLQPTFEIGSEARGTVGNTSGGAQSKVSPVEHEAVVYSDRTGFFGGADVKAGDVTPDDDANVIYYGQSVTMGGILFNRAVVPTATGTQLIHDLTDYSRMAKVSPNHGN